MKKIRFVFIMIVIALVLGSFFVAPTQKSVAASAPRQSSSAAVLPDFSPFLLSANAYIVPEGGSSPEAYNGYACQLVAQSPADWSYVKSRQIFDTTWVLKNTGTKVWGLHGVDVRYRGDTPMHTRMPDLTDIPRQIGIGQKLTLTVDMIAPKAPGYYVSNWGLYVGSQVFCKFYVIVVVTR